MNTDQVIEDLARAVRALAENQKELKMLGQDILDAIAAETSVIDSFITLVRGLVANNTIDSATAQRIFGVIQADKAKLEAAIVENTPPPPPSPRAKR